MRRSLPRLVTVAVTLVMVGLCTAERVSADEQLMASAAVTVLQALDAHSTMSAIRNGAHEANPFMQGVAKSNSAMLAVKAGVAASTIFFAEKMWKRNRVGAVAMMIALNTIDAMVVVHNYGVASRLR